MKTFSRKNVFLCICVYFDVWLVSRRKIIKTDFDDDSKVEAKRYWNRVQNWNTFMMHYYSFLPLTQRSSTFSPLGKSSSRLLRFESVHNGNKVIRGYSVQQTENEDETRTESSKRFFSFMKEANYPSRFAILFEETLEKQQKMLFLLGSTFLFHYRCKCDHLIRLSLQIELLVDEFTTRDFVFQSVSSIYE